MVIELKPAVIKGSKERNYILNRAERRRHNRVIQNIQKSRNKVIQSIQKMIDRTPDPQLKASLQKTLDNALKKLK